MKEIKGTIGNPENNKIDIDKYVYLKEIITAYNVKYNTVPDLDFLCEKASLTENQIKIYIDNMLVEEFLEIIENRSLNGSSLGVKSNVVSIKKESKQECEKEKLEKQDVLFNSKKEKVKKELKIPIIFNNWINVLRIILIFIGTGAVYMSVFYSYRWLIDFLIPVRALLLSAILVCFAVAAFELIIFFKQQNKKILIGVFSFLWIIVTIFSMVSTVAGQYNARIEKMNTQYSQETDIENNNRNYQNYIEQKKDYQESLLMAQKEANQYQEMLLTYDTQEKIEENKKFYATLQWRYQKSLKEIRRLKWWLKRLRSDKKFNKIKKHAPDFYVWLSQIWNFRPEMIQFWMSMFPALFIDIIASLSFAVVMFVGRKKEI
jgi:hypothetical protein